MGDNTAAGFGLVSGLAALSLNGVNAALGIACGVCGLIITAPKACAVLLTYARKTARFFRRHG